jgi:hypothetical protein
VSQNPVIGQMQLLAWEKAAADWSLYYDQDGHARCGMCEVSVWRIRDDSGKTYTYQPSEILALKVAHIRQCHSVLEPLIYQEAGIN